MYYGEETGRINFMVNRDGLEAAKEWAHRVAGQYRAALLDKGDMNRLPHYARSREFRRKFICAYSELKEFGNS